MTMSDLSGGTTNNNLLLCARRLERVLPLELHQSGNNTADDGWAVVQSQRSTDANNNSNDRLVDDAGRQTHHEHTQSNDFAQGTLSPAYQQSVDVVEFGTASTSHRVGRQKGGSSHGRSNNSFVSKKGFQLFHDLQLQKYA